MKKILIILFGIIQIVYGGGETTTGFHIDLNLDGLPANESVKVINTVNSEEIELTQNGITGFDTNLDETGKFKLAVNQQPDTAYCYIIRKTGFYLENNPLIDIKCIDNNNVFQVNSTEDSDDNDLSDGVCDDGNGHCTLRAAINQSNQLDKNMTIILSPSTYQISSELTIENNTTIVGDDIKENIVIDAGGNSRVFSISNDMTVNIYNISIINGEADMYEGGGIDIGENADVKLQGIIISDCNATSGGALRTQMNSSVYIKDSIFKHNTTTGKAANTGNGGAILAQGAYIDIRKTLIDDNSATSGTDTYGGGIHLNNGTLYISDSTIFGNSASYGGGISINSDTSASIYNNTITLNNNSGLYIIDHSNCYIEVINTIIVAQNSGDDCSGDVSIDTVSHNIASDDSCGFKNIMNLYLEPLSDNGGPTPTTAIRYNSPARDFGDSSKCSDSDQRYAIRNGDCDIGAFEYHTFPINVTMDLNGVNLDDYNITAVKVINAKTEEEEAYFDNINNGNNNFTFTSNDGTVVGIEATLDNNSSNIVYYNFKESRFENRKDGSVVYYTTVSKEENSLDIDASNHVYISPLNFAPTLHIKDGSYLPLGDINTPQAQELAIDRDRKILYTSFYDDSDNSGIKSYDYRDPHNPIILASISESSNRVRDMVLSKSQKELFVARESGLYIYDVNDTTNITQISTLFDSNYNLYKMVYSATQNMLYILGDDSSDSLQHIYIVDINNPTSPQLQNKIDLDSNKIFINLAIYNNKLYLFAEDKDGDTYDISDPSSPQTLDIHPPMMNAIVSDDGTMLYGVSIRDTYDNLKVGVVDTSNMEWKSYVEVPLYGIPSLTLDKNNNHLYVGSNTPHLKVFNLSDPNNVSISSYIYDSSNGDMRISDDLLFISNKDRDYIHIRDIIDSPIFNTIKTKDDLDDINSGYWENAYIPMHSDKLYHYLGGIYNGNNNGEIIEFDQNSLEVIDTILINDWDSGLNLYDISADNTYAIANDTQTSFIDSDTNFISPLFKYDNDNSISDVALTASKNRKIAYMLTYNSSNSSSSLLIYNTDDILSKIDIDENVNINSIPIADMLLYESKNILFVSVGNTIFSLDISNPYFPKIVDSISVNNTYRLSIDYIRDRLYSYSSDCIISAIDISNPTDMSIISQYSTPQNSCNTENIKNISLTDDPNMVFTSFYDSNYSPIQITVPDNSNHFRGEAYLSSVVDFLISNDNSKMNILEEHNNDSGPTYILRQIDITPRIYLPEGFENYTIPVQLFDKEEDELNITAESSDSSIFTVSSGEGSYNSSDYESSPINITISEGDTTGIARLWVRVEDTNSAIKEMPLDIVVYPTLKRSTTIPEAPSNLQAVEIEANYVKLNWIDNADNEEGFKLYRSVNGSQYEEISNSIEADSTEYIDTTVSENNSYSYRLTAYNSNGESDYVEVNVTTPNIINPPNAPSSLTLEANSSSVILRWQDNADTEDGFRVYRDDTLLNENIPQNSISFIDDTVEEGKRYRYCVSAYNSGGESASTCASITIPLNLPAAPRNFMAVAYPHKIILNWEDVSDTEDYYVLKRDNVVIDDKIPANSTSYVDENVTPDTTYTYALASRNENGDSPYQLLTVTTPKDIPAPPTEFNASADYNSVYLTWVDNADNENGFILYRNGELLTDAIAPDSSEYNDTTVTENTTYTYRLAAYNENGVSESVTVTIKTPTKLPIAPSDLNATASIDEVTLNWIDNSYNEEYFVLYRDGQLLDDEIPANSTSYVDRDIEPNRIYSYQLLARNSEGDSTPIDTEVITPFIFIFNLQSIESSPREITAIDIVDESDRILASYNGDEQISIQMKRGGQYGVRVTAKVYGDIVKYWYLNFDNNIFDTEKHYTSADISQTPLTIDLSASHWQTDRPIFIQYPSDIVISADSAAITLPIKIDHNNYEGLKLEADTNSSSIISISPEWDSIQLMSEEEYENRTFNLTLTPHNEGIATITLKLTDNYGNEEVKSFQVTVYKDIRISADPIEGEAPLTVQFNLSINDNFQPIDSIEWDFGDGNSSNDMNPIYEYVNPGNYTARVTVKNRRGEIVSESIPIIVSEKRFVYHLKKGRNDISLPSKMSLDEDGLQKYFSDPRIDMLVKRVGYSWAYWDSDLQFKAERRMGRFSTLDSTEGFIVYAKESFDLRIPYEESDDENRDDFIKLYDGGWYFVGVNENKSVDEINELVSRQGKELEMIEYFDNEGVMHFYSPIKEIDDNTAKDIPRLESVERDWGFFIRIR